MHPVRRRQFMTLIFILVVLGMVTALVLYALRQNISLFYTPTEVSEGKAPIARVIRVGGMVVKGSIVRAAHSLKLQFVISDYQQQLTLYYEGVLPDLFREGQGVIAKGILDKEGQFNASEILAKHDENYMPPELQDALNKNKTKGQS